jgi:hypothetical protein
MVGTLEQPPNDENSIVRFWEWQSGRRLPTLNTSMEAPNTNEYDDTMTIPNADDQNTTITMKIRVGGNC